jgi:hypothetical protein
MKRLAFLCVLGGSVAAHAQTVQYRSPAGETYRSQADTGPVARAQHALAANPRDMKNYVALGTAQAGARQMQ